MRRWISTIISTLMLTIAALAGQTVSDSQSKPPSADVTSDRAIFRFAIPNRSSWEWHAPARQPSNVEYQWMVEVTNAGSHYQFGFVLLQATNAPREHGTFEELIRAGRQIVTRTTGSHAAAGVTGVRLGFSVEPGVLQIAVEDPPSRQLLLSDRPSTATFRTRMPGDSGTIRQVKIVYRD